MAIFNSKIVAEGQDYTDHNGEMVEILGKIKGRDVYSTRYTVRFQDGTIAEVMSCELEW